MNRALTFGDDHVGLLVIRRPLRPTKLPWARGTTVEVGLGPESMWAVPG